MADYSPDSSDKSELSGLKHISTSLFSIPGFFVGFGAKGTSESDVSKSPTSPLDFGVFTNFGGLFSPRSLACSFPRRSQRNKWGHDKVGLSILNSLDNDAGSGNEDRNDSLERENVVLAPQIKINVPKTSKLSGEWFDPSLKSNSLPKNYATTSVCDSVNFHLQPGNSHMRISEEPNSPMKSSSSPVNIISSRVYSRSLSAREMALSEDYTCIISHGPNPKTTHIFGDCILDCDPKELADVNTKEEGEHLTDDSVPKPLEDFSSCFCSCKQKLLGVQSAGIHSFCSCSMETLVEGEIKNVRNNSLEVSPGSSYHENLFPMGMPLNS